MPKTRSPKHITQGDQKGNISRIEKYTGKSSYRDHKRVGRLDKISANAVEEGSMVSQFLHEVKEKKS